MSATNVHEILTEFLDLMPGICQTGPAGKTIGVVHNGAGMMLRINRNILVDFKYVRS